MVDHNAGEKPIEYWISRSTDPFIDEETRKQNVQKLCDRVNYEADGAMVATGILAHRIVSPDQDEALYSLQAVDQLVRKCGEKVHNRVGKFRFLNQLVKLITPKYLGAQTSPEVKELAIKLLYSWQKSMRHVEKFKEVYDSLREHHLITADPIIPEEEIMIVQSNPPKLAVFEDEEKARLLKELLKSTNPDDLQAANRLIQTLEDQKIERRHKRADELEQVRQLCKRLEDAMMEKTAEELGITPDIIYTEAKMKTLADELMAVRPHLFRFASDATENDEEALAEILAVNDQVNQLIQKYRNFSQTGRVRQHNGGSSEEAADLLGPEPNDSVTGPTSSTVPLDFNADALLKQKFSKEVPSSSSEFADVPFIGFDRSMTPALPRKVKPPSQPATSVLDDLTTLIDGDLFSKQPPSQTFKNIKPTLNDLCTSSSVSNVSISPLDNLNRSTFE
ncbi:VHS domain protein, partial [Necator americanus]